MNKLERLTRTIEALTRAYQRRKQAGRPYGHLLPRCRRLSAAWLDQRNEQFTTTA